MYFLAQTYFFDAEIFSGGEKFSAVSYQGNGLDFLLLYVESHAILKRNKICREGIGGHGLDESPICYCVDCFFVGCS